jgi:hypothetical protein
MEEQSRRGCVTTERIEEPRKIKDMGESEPKGKRSIGKETTRSSRLKLRDRGKPKKGGKTKDLIR